LLDATLEALRTVGDDVAEIDVELFQQPFAGPGELLHRVQNRQFIAEAQVIEQLDVGIAMNPRLEPAQVDWHPVRRLMIESLEHPLPRIHRFSMCHCNASSCHSWRGRPALVLLWQGHLALARGQDARDTQGRDGLATTSTA